MFPSEITGIEWGYIILEQEAVYPLFSGHNTICVVTALLVRWCLMALFNTTNSFINYHLQYDSTFIAFV